MAFLRIVNGPNAGRTYQLTEAVTMVGRDPLCRVVLPSRTISREHARVLQQNNRFYLEDLQSVNGTFVNGQRIEHRHDLQESDCIQIYDTIIRFHVHEPTDEDATVETEPAPNAATQELHRGELHLLDFDATQDALDVNPGVKLRAILEITRNLGSSLDADVVLPRILESLFRIFPQADHGYVLQPERFGGDLVPRAIKQRGDESDTISPISGTIAARVMSEGKAFLSDDPSHDQRLEEQMSESIFDEKMRSVMCAPLMGPSHKPLGVIHLDTDDAKHPFQQQDLDVLMNVASLAGQALEYARVHEELLELDRKRRELSMANNVQRHFLPDQRPQITGYTFFDDYRPADSVAGDYFDYIDLPDGRLALALGDVSGKGVSAALMMARLGAEVRYCLLATSSPAEATTRLNRQISRQLTEGRFVTFILFVLDPWDHLLTVVNAGHTPPLIREGSSGEVHELDREKSGLPLGVDSEDAYQQVQIKMEPGDLLLAYTDGINEAVNPAGQVYGFDRIKEIVAKRGTNPGHVSRALIADVRTFMAGQLQSDDICLLCFGRNPDKKPEQ